MSNITEKIEKILKEKNLTKYKIMQMTNSYAGSLYKMIDKKIQFTDQIIDKLFPILEVSKEEFLSWIIADNYEKEAIELGIVAKKAPFVLVTLSQSKKVEDNKLILTNEIDKIIIEKGLSRTKLCELAGEKEGTLNKPIIGKTSMTPKVVAKLAPVLEVSENQIRAWILADKYSLQTLELALKEVSK
jgi:plasmid maintenance system antidote protein VapI